MALDPGNVEAMVGLAAVDSAIGAAFMTDDWISAVCGGRGDSHQGSFPRTEPRFGPCTPGLRPNVYEPRGSRSLARCEQALALDRNLAHAHALIGFAKYCLGRGAETEAHINEAFRLSPRDTLGYRWMVMVGLAKVQLNADAEAVVWLRRGLEANRNYSVAHFHLAAALARLGALDQARAAAKAGLAFDPTFTIRRFRALPLVTIL